VDQDLRVDPALGTVVHVVGNRQSRPNLATNAVTSDCPFCVGGIEAPEAYDVRSFVNRWPPMPNDRCEVILYTSDHNDRSA
jgi:UDPglucose--hexose-1-phosphate uridylyltransferase